MNNKYKNRTLLLGGWGGAGSGSGSSGTGPCPPCPDAPMPFDDGSGSVTLCDICGEPPSTCHGPSSHNKGGDDEGGPCSNCTGPGPAP